MTAGVLLDRKAAVRRSWSKPADTRTGLHNDVDRRPDTKPRADPDHEGAVVVHDFTRERIRVIDPERFEVEGGVPANLPREHRADRRRLRIPEIVRAFDRRPGCEIKWPPLTLLCDRICGEELDGLVGGAVKSDLTAWNEAEAVLDA